LPHSGFSLSISTDEGSYERHADAVVHSVKRLIDPAFKSEQISFFSTIKDAKEDY
jgi:hypothetical protein